MPNPNSQNYLRPTKELGQLLKLLGDHAAHEPNSPISIHPGLEHWRKNLFEIVCVFH
jgi:hypothetical protein